MVISIAVHGAPYASQASHSALRFSECALARGHVIHRIFFYHEGVLAAGNHGIAPQDEEDIHAGWVALQQSHGIELAACIGNSVKRGMLNEEERDRYEKAAATVDSRFTIVGLGQLVDAIAACDRFVTFAA